MNNAFRVPLRAGGGMPEYRQQTAGPEAGANVSARLDDSAGQIINAQATRNYNTAMRDAQNDAQNWEKFNRGLQSFLHTGNRLYHEYRDRTSRAYVDEALMQAREEMEAWRTDYDQTHKGQNGLQAAADYQQAWAKISEARMKGLREKGVSGPYEQLADLHLRENGIHYDNQGLQYQRQQDKNWNTSIFEGKKDELVRSVQADPNNSAWQGFLSAGVLEAYKRLHPGEDTTKFENELKNLIATTRIDTKIAANDFAGAAADVAVFSGGGSSYGGVGALAVGHESGGDPGKVSPDTSGSYSYGLFQFNSKPGGTAHSFMPFLKQNHPKIYAALGHGYLKVGSKEFNQVFHDVANGEMKDEMIKAQQEHLLATYAEPAERKLGGAEFQKKFGGNAAYREVMLSTAIQHGPGGAARILREAWGKVDKGAGEQEQLEQFIQATYQLRGRPGEFRTALSEKQSDAARQRFMNGMQRRYSQEAAQALQIARGGSVPGGYGQSVLTPKQRIHYDATLAAAEDKVEKEVMKDFPDVKEKLKFGDTSEALRAADALEARGLANQAKAWRDAASVVEQTKETRQWAAKAPLPVLMARVQELEKQADPDFPALPNENLTAAEGLLEQGNIDLHKRPKVQLKDGSTATVRSMSFNFDGKEVLIPTISQDGRELSEDEAIAEYKRTGKHLGKFDTPEHADAYAEKLHQNQEAEYVGGRKKELVEHQRINSSLKICSEILADRSRAYKTDPAAAAQNDAGLVMPDNATPEEQVRLRMEIQRENGVLSPVPLTKQETESLGKQYAESATPVVFLDNLRKAYGAQTNAVVGQLVNEKKVPRQANLILDMDPNAAGVLAITSRKDWVKDAEKARGMKDSDRESLRTKIRDTMEDVLHTLLMQGDSNGVEAISSAAYGMTLYYITSGVSAGDAVERATQEVFSGRYKVNGTFRVPIRYAATDEDLEGVVNGAKWAVNDIAKKAGDYAISVPFQTGMTESQVIKRKEELIRSNSRWVTNKDESGLYLIVGTHSAPLRKKDGTLVEITFEDLQKMGKARGTTLEETYGPQGVMYEEKR